MFTFSMPELISDVFQELLFRSFYIMVISRNFEIPELYSEFMVAKHTAITDLDFTFCL